MLKKISDSFEEQISKQKHVVDTITQENLQLEAQIDEKRLLLWKVLPAKLKLQQTNTYTNKMGDSVNYQTR